MNPKIIVGIVPERTEETGDALITAARLAATDGADLLALEVVDPATTAAQRTEHEQAMQRAIEIAFANGTPRPDIELRVIAAPSAARVLNELADRTAVKAIVVGISRRGPDGEAVPGSVGELLLHGGGAPVVVAPHGSTLHTGGLGLIAVGYQETPESHAALRGAAELAIRADATLRLIAVLESTVANPFAFAGEAGESDAEHEQHRRAYLSLREAAASVAVPTQVQVLSGDPATTLAIASQGFSLLVLGSRGYGPQRAVLLGPVSRALVRTVACPVMIVPRPSTTKPEAALAGALDLSLGA